LFRRVVLLIVKSTGLEDILVIEYCGAIQYETIGELIHKLKGRVHELNIPTGTYKRILLVMIESLENIMKHSDNPPNAAANDTSHMPTFSITKREDHYTVMASNLIKIKAVEQLRNKLDLLNSMDTGAMKEYYKETITNGVFTNTGGASLGLIEIAKISGATIRYEFLPVDKERFRFTQWVSVENGANY
jgi:hypothetical protein